jgi:glyoxylase-like metal-dependent hydrolase (beta-lactamase superfamily II)
MLRRKFLKNSALISTFPLINNHFNFFNPATFMNDDVVRIKIGDIDCTIFRDTMFKYLAKDFFINVNEEELSKGLEKYHIQSGNIPSPFTPILIQRNDKKILIDTGIGFTEKPVVVRGNSVVFKGRLHELLREESIKKEDITDVVITHFHPDHIGGIYSEDGELNFPNAQFHTHEDEWNYWHSAKSDNQPDQFKYFIEKNMTKLKEQNLHLIKGDLAELFPGITVVKVNGHTPGQIAVIVDSQKHHLLYISDAFLHPLHIEQLDWQTNYDLDHEKAKQSRIKLLELAYKDDMVLNAFHFDFPGLGYVDKYNNNWIWQYKV